MPPGVTGVAGVLLWTSDERHPAMRAFYAETLGMRPRSDRLGFVNFELGGARLTVAVHGEVSGPARDPLRIMVNLAVDGLDEMHRRLIEKEVPCLRPRSGELGRAVATYTDPDGNVVQLFELPDSSSDGASPPPRSPRRAAPCATHQPHRAAPRRPARRRRRGACRVGGPAHLPGSSPAPYPRRRSPRARRGATSTITTGGAKRRRPSPARSRRWSTAPALAGEIQGPATQRCDQLTERLLHLDAVLQQHADDQPGSERATLVRSRKLPEARSMASGSPSSDSISAAASN